MTKCKKDPRDTGFVDFFNQEIKFGDWVEIAKTSGGAYFRFAMAEKLGSTGNLLFRVFWFYNPTTCYVGPKLVGYPKDQVHNLRKIHLDHLPPAVYKSIVESFPE